MPRLARVQQVVLPILRARPQLAGVHIGTCGEDIDYRMFPTINIRRIGGSHNWRRPKELVVPVIEMTAYGSVGLVETELLYDDALEALYDAVLYQVQTPVGYLHSIKETMGSTQFSSLFQDSWRIQGLIQLGVRPPNKN